MGFALTALLEASRGHDDAAVAAIATASSLNVGDVQNEGMLCAAQAQVALNAGDVEAARRAARGGVDMLMGSQSE